MGQSGLGWGFDRFWIARNAALFCTVFLHCEAGVKTQHSLHENQSGDGMICTASILVLVAWFCFLCSFFCASSGSVACFWTWHRWTRLRRSPLGQVLVFLLVSPVQVHFSFSFLDLFLSFFPSSSFLSFIRFRSGPSFCLLSRFYLCPSMPLRNASSTELPS